MCDMEGALCGVEPQEVVRNQLVGELLPYADQLP